MLIKIRFNSKGDCERFSKILNKRRIGFMMSESVMQITSGDTTLPYELQEILNSNEFRYDLSTFYQWNEAKLELLKESQV